jgi:adenylate cyclase
MPDALRRTFLKLNQDLHDSLFASSRKGSHVSGSGSVSGGRAKRGGGGGRAGAVDLVILRSGVSRIVLYFVGKMMYVANVGKTLVVVSRQGVVRETRMLHRS